MEVNKIDIKKINKIIIKLGFPIYKRESFSLILSEFVYNGGGVVILRAANEPTGNYSLDHNFPHVIYFLLFYHFYYFIHVLIFIRFNFCYFTFALYYNLYFHYIRLFIV